MPGTLRGVLENDTKTREKNYLNGLNMKKVESGGVSIILKTGTEVAQYYTIFNYGPPIPQKCFNPHVKTYGVIGGSVDV